MALHNNLNLFYLLLLFISSLVLPPHLAQPEASPSSSPSPSPSPGPTSSGSSSPSPSPGPTSFGSSSPSSSPLPGPTSSGPTPSTAPSSANNLIDDGPDIQDFIVSLFPSLSNFRSTIPNAAAPSDDSDTIIGIDLSQAKTPSPDASVDPKIQKICETTDYPSLCIAMVSPYVNGKTDVPSVLGVAIKGSTALTKVGQSMADKLAGDRSQMSSSLDECKEDFDNAVDNFGKAMGSLPEQDKGTINSMLSAVITNVADCQEKISKESDLYSVSDKLVNMTSNCLAIASLLN